jgi:hypothetical protein
MNRLKRFWIKEGAMLLCVAMLVSMTIGNMAMGICVIMFTTVPCSTPIINKHWYFWYPRQLCFIAAGLYLMK